MSKSRSTTKSHDSFNQNVNEIHITNLLSDDLSIKNDPDYIKLYHDLKLWLSTVNTFNNEKDLQLDFYQNCLKKYDENIINKLKYTDGFKGTVFKALFEQLMPNFCLIDYYNSHLKSKTSDLDLEFLPFHIVTILELKIKLKDCNIRQLLHYLRIILDYSPSSRTYIIVLKFNKWKQNAITVAGGNGKGQQLNQLDWPGGIFMDKNKNIFIADNSNHRIVEWKYDATEGQIIAGGNNKGNRINQLRYPTDVIIDQHNHSIIIADYGNNRVIQWLNQKQKVLIENIDCFGLAMDKYGFLYVTDRDKHEVRRWKMGKYNNEGIVVAGGNEKGDQLNQLNFPTFIFVDEDQSVYVADDNNHRVMKWRKDAKEGKIVAGGNGKGENLNQLSKPEGVIVDDLGQIYVADRGNDRIMRWREGKEEGEIVVGGNGKGNQTNQLNSPVGISFDDEGNLYIADYFNHRIQKFELIS
ncbi:unnamed protein product [Adineta steineri]|uniref:NHL repeat containing protein n=1 Tax=Adineta steineri TaxID=433720 RepID=A0A815ITP9_9BILA|nr:unnamed protein product [Adineta steineri]